jgi:hypothetical protein
MLRDIAVEARAESIATLSRSLLTDFTMARDLRSRAAEMPQPRVWRDPRLICMMLTVWDAGRSVKIVAYGP